MRLSVIKRFIHIWFFKNQLKKINSRIISYSYLFCCLLFLYFIPFFILGVFDVLDMPSFLMMIIFMVLAYVVVIPRLSKLRLKFRKRWMQIIDIIVVSWFFPLIFVCVLFVFLYIVGRIDGADRIDSKERICCFAVPIYTMFLIYFRFLYYKHIEAVAAKDDEEKRQKEIVSIVDNDVHPTYSNNKSHCNE